MRLYTSHINCKSTKYNVIVYTFLKYFRNIMFPVLTRQFKHKHSTIKNLAPCMTLL